MISHVVAKTHTSDYLLHKYWARKPHNVLAEIIRILLPGAPARVLDPFCGSGVFLREASLQGHKGLGFDVNPVAVRISRTTCDSPSVRKFSDTVAPILEWFQEVCKPYYSTSAGEAIRYYVHECVTNCSNCGEHVARSRVAEGRSKKCPACGGRISFSLASLAYTNIVAIAASKTVTSQDELRRAKELERGPERLPYNNYALAFPLNKRILSHQGMVTSDLFTARNFALLSLVADKMHEIEDPKVRDAALLLLTSSVAQCSRLIPYRNNLKTGGPAWSVPGFWVPALHLETNPSTHLNARYKKFLRGLRALELRPAKATVEVRAEDCINLQMDDGPFDLVFLDPPYGDSVPYMEFSMLWNSFLKDALRVESDISVSDREGKKAESWAKYRAAMIDRIGLISSRLTEQGTVVLTFNNNDYRAWEALIEATQNAELSCLEVKYQAPAVVSAKAQFSKDGSYISDIYAIFRKTRSPHYTESLRPVQDELLNTSTDSEPISRALAYRVAYLSLLKNNISHHQFKNVDDLLTKFLSGQQLVRA